MNSIIIKIFYFMHFTNDISVIMLRLNVLPIFSNQNFDI